MHPKKMSYLLLDMHITKVLTANVRPGWRREVPTVANSVGELLYTQTHRGGVAFRWPRPGRHRDVTEPQPGHMTAGLWCDTERRKNSDSLPVESKNTFDWLVNWWIDWRMDSYSLAFWWGKKCLRVKPTNQMRCPTKKVRLKIKNKLEAKTS